MPNINLRAKNPMIIQEGLNELEQTTSHALADHVGLPKATADAVLSEMLKLEMVHICAWARSKRGIRLRVYMIGKGINATQPIKVNKTKEERSTSRIPDAILKPRCDEAAAWMRNPICTHP